MYENSENLKKILKQIYDIWFEYYNCEQLKFIEKNNGESKYYFINEESIKKFKEVTHYEKNKNAIRDYYPFQNLKKIIENFYKREKVKFSIEQKIFNNSQELIDDINKQNYYIISPDLFTKINNCKIREKKKNKIKEKENKIKEKENKNETKKIIIYKLKEEVKIKLIKGKYIIEFKNEEKL